MSIHMDISIYQEVNAPHLIVYNLYTQEQRYELERSCPILEDRGIRTEGFELCLSETNDLKIDICNFLTNRFTLFG